MVEEKKKLIREIIIDIIFTIGIIILTIYGTIYVFPKVDNVNVMTIEKYECENSFNCDCNGKKCNCKYCNDLECNNVKEIKCLKKYVLK